VKTVAVAVPEMGVEVLSLISECIMEARIQYLRGNGSPGSGSRSRSDLSLSECEVRTEEAGTLLQLHLGIVNHGTIVQLHLGSAKRDALAVELEGGAAGKLASSNDVGVNADVTDAALHVASTRLSNDPGDVDTASSVVTGLETLLVCVSVHETVLN